MKRKRHVYQLQHDLLTENIIPKSDSQLPMVGLVNSATGQTHRPMGSCRPAKGSLCVHSEGRTACWMGEHVASETIRASLQPSGTAGQTGTVAKLYKGKWPLAGVRRRRDIPKLTCSTSGDSHHSICGVQAETGSHQSEVT